MIIKSHELNKLNLNLNKIVLFYGNNEGLKNQSIDLLLKNLNKAHVYEESEILENQKNFLEDLLSKSLFEENTNKLIKDIYKEIYKRVINPVYIIILSLEKKSSTFVNCDTPILE